MAGMVSTAHATAFQLFKCNGALLIKKKKDKTDISK